MMTLFQLLVAIVLAKHLALSASASGPQPGQIKNLVAFGDSYTDISGHDDGGTVWPVFAAEDGNFTLFPFAKVSATCSNALTPRPFPSIFEAQLPAYFDAKANGSLNAPKPHNTMYTLRIGTNDVGANALLTGGQTPGVTVVDTVTCAVDWVRAPYDGGARNSIVFQNMIPLETVPLYTPDSYPNLYWNVRRNTTKWSVFMRQLTTSGNVIASLQLKLLAGTLEGTHIEPYLNGTGPFNVAGAAHAYVFRENESQHDRGVCTDATDLDRFLWYDELHPSVQASRAMAKMISDAIRRRSEKWITWLRYALGEVAPGAERLDAESGFCT